MKKEPISHYILYISSIGLCISTLDPIFCPTPKTCLIVIIIVLLTSFDLWSKTLINSYELDIYTIDCSTIFHVSFQFKHFLVTKHIIENK